MAFHKTRELLAIGCLEEETVYQGLLAAFIGDFTDVRDLAERPAYLDEDPAIAYPEGQAFAAALRENGGRGIIYPSARRKGGICLVAFHPHLVQNVRPGARWKLIWDGSPEYTAVAD